MTAITDKNKLSATYILALFTDIPRGDFRPMTREGRQHEKWFTAKGKYFAVPHRGKKPPPLHKRWKKIGKLYTRNIYQA